MQNAIRIPDAMQLQSKILKDFKSEGIRFPFEKSHREDERATKKQRKREIAETPRYILVGPFAYFILGDQMDEGTWDI